MTKEILRFEMEFQLKINAMKTQNTWNFDDIVFEHRNKNYGAYQLRKTYGKRTLASISIATLCLVGFLFALIPEPVAIEKEAPKIVPTELMNANIQKIKVEPKKVPLKPVLQNKIKSSGGVNNTTLTIVSNGGGGVAPGKNPGPGGGSDDDDFGFPQDPVFELDTTTVRSKPPTKPFEPFAQYMPEFPGGYNALAEYMGENVYYPERIRQLGVEGTVYISFVVEADGSIARVSVERGIDGGSELEKIAIQAVKKMPNWTPGRNGNTTVAVKQVIPIQFSLVTD